MKAFLYCFSSRTRTPSRPRTLAFCLSAWALVLAPSGPLLAAPEVQTITGGPSAAYPGDPAGYVDGDTAKGAQFHTPYGIALDATGNSLFVADRDNNAIRQIDQASGQTFTFTTDQISQPVGVAVDKDGKVYVLNRGDGNNGTLLIFDSVGRGGNFLATKAANLVNAAGITLDPSTNIYFTYAGNKVDRITPTGDRATVTTFTEPGVSLQGITVKRDGYLVVCDAGLNGIWRIDPNSGQSNRVAGFHGAGDFANPNNIASSSTARFNQPLGIAATGDGTLVVTDNGNHRVKAVLESGVVTNLYGVSANFWVQGSPSQGIFPGWFDGTVMVPDVLGTVEARSPVGVVFAPDGSLFTSEVYYHLIRQVTGTGLALPPPPPEPVPPPRVGWVDFTVPPSIVISVLQTGSGDGTTFTFNNDRIVAIEGIDGTETHFTAGPTPSGVDTLPNPNPFVGSTPPVYHDGLFPNQVPPSIITPQPDVTVKAINFQTGRPSSKIIQARFIFKTASPVILGNNAAQFKVASDTAGAEMWYTTDGSDPVNAPPSVGPIVGSTLNPVTLSLNIQTNTTFRVRAFRNNYQPSEIASQVFSLTNVNANQISFGFASGEASSDFVAAPGQLFYAPVTLSILPGTKMYSLQFNVVVTNVVPAPPVSAELGFESKLVKPKPLDPSLFVQIPPAMFLGVTTNIEVVTNIFGTNQFVFTNIVFVPGYTNPPPGNKIIYPFDDFSPFLDLRFVNASENLIGVGWLERLGKKNLYDTTQQDLIAFSLPHDTLFASGNGKVVLGGYAFRVPPNAAAGQQYLIRLGRPSATSDGVGAPGSEVFIDTPTKGSLTNGAINSVKLVTAGQRRYVVGDAAPFRWFNAGDFGDTNLVNADVMQIFQSAIYSLNYPPPGSDFFDGMDSCCGTYAQGPGYLVPGPIITDTNALNGLFGGNDTAINGIAFGDGSLDVTDVYVTFRRSLDPALFWFERFWTNGVRGAQSHANGAPLPPPPAPLTVPVAPTVTFSAGDAIAASGQTILIPINARIRGDYPLRVLALGLTVEPLDGSPAITVPVEFLSSALGAPTITQSRGAANFAATWLNSAITGVSGDVQLGALQITLPENAPASAAYAIHFDHASASPNGLVPFPKTVRGGLLTRSDRSTSSYNDGIPDAWRLRYFGTLNNLLSAATADADGDGANTLQEYLAGTDPNDRTSVLRASASKAGDQPFVIRWPSVEGKQYEIERSVTLFGDWNKVSTIGGTGAEMQFQDASSGNVQYFYRVRVAE